MNYRKSLKYIFKKGRATEIVSIIILLATASAFKLSVNQLKQEGVSGLATLAVNIGFENRLFEGGVYDGMTVLDALNMAMSVGKIKLNYVLDNNNQTRVMEIDGHVDRTEDKYFVFYLNNKKIDSMDLNKIHLKTGDDIVIKLEQ